MKISFPWKKKQEKKRKEGKQFWFVVYLLVIPKGWKFEVEKKNANRIKDGVIELNEMLENDGNISVLCRLF